MCKAENTATRKIAIYSRKSKFTGKGESIENQIGLCRAYIASHLPEVSASDIMVFEDEGFSGGHMDRPEFKRMMALAKRREVSHIVCYRLDRISRNIGDFASLIEELNELGTGFISIKEQFDTSSPMGRAMMYIASVFSQLERETIAERIRDNMRELAKTGRWLGGATPTGFRSEPVESVTVDGKHKKAFHLVPIEDEVNLVRLIYSKFIETNSISKTETFLLRNNYKTKNGRDFSRFSIRNILENPVYMNADRASFEYFKRERIELFADERQFDGAHGVIAYNRTVQKRGRAHELRNMSDWIIAIGQHEGIISGADWSKVQRMLSLNKDKSYRKPRSNVALLSGLLYCGRCGDYMRPKLGKRMTDDGERMYHYLCSMKERSRMTRCDMINPNGNELDRLVCDEIKNLSENPKTFLSQLEKAKSELASDRPGVEDEIARLVKLKTETQLGISNLTKTLASVNSSSAEGHILRQIEEMDIELVRIGANITELDAIAADTFVTDTEFELLRDMLCNFGTAFEEMSIEQKRAALRSLVKRVVWDGENAHVYLFGHTDDEVELPPVAATFDEEGEPSCPYSKRNPNGAAQ